MTEMTIRADHRIEKNTRECIEFLQGEMFVNDKKYSISGLCAVSEVPGSGFLYESNETFRTALELLTDNNIWVRIDRTNYKRIKAGPVNIKKQTAAAPTLELASSAVGLKEIQKQLVNLNALIVDGFIQLGVVIPKAGDE